MGCVGVKTVLIKTPSGLRGSTPEDHEAWTKFRRKLEVMRDGAFIRFDWSTPRNGPHHRKGMALLHLIAENSETWNTTEKALIAVKLVVGHFDLVADPKTGEISQIPRSISFDAMDQESFEIFYSQAIDGILQHILPTIDRKTMDRLLDLIVSGWA